jgi:hypothetical protein
MPDSRKLWGKCKLTGLRVLSAMRACPMYEYYRRKTSEPSVRKRCDSCRHYTPNKTVQMHKEYLIQVAESQPKETE